MYTKLVSTPTENVLKPVAENIKSKELNKKPLSAAVAVKISEEIAFVKYLTVGTEQKKSIF